MTLAVAWIRDFRAPGELVFASDSRLTGGRTWDSCPKLFDLGRSDCLVAFAGATEDAYPLLLQLHRAVDFYPPSRERRVDLPQARGHLMRIFNGMLREIRGAASGATPSVAFLFGGYSWRRASFQLWSLHYNHEEGVIRHDTVVPRRHAGSDVGGPGSTYRFIGDCDAVDEANRRVRDLVYSRGKTLSAGLDMEPLEVLRDLIREKQFDSVGGPPQVAKVYSHMNTAVFSVEWNGRATVGGRPLLSYEVAFVPRIDLDRLDDGRGGRVPPG